MDSLGSIVLFDGGEGSGVPSPPGHVYDFLFKTMVAVPHGEISLGQTSVSKLLSLLSPLSVGGQCGGFGYLEIDDHSEP